MSKADTGSPFDANGPRLRRHLRAPARFTEPTLVVLFFLGAFELAARTHPLWRPEVLPPPSIIAKALWNAVVHGHLVAATWVTVRQWGLGMLIVIAIAIPLGLVLGASSLTYHGARLTVEIMRTVPSIAAIPFLVLLYGLGTKLTVVLVLLAATWPLLLLTMSGVHDVDPVARDTGRVYGLNRLQEFWRVVLPSAAPYIATGLRISATLGLLVAIGASLFAGGEGLGQQILAAQGTFNTPLVFAGVFVAGLLGLVVFYSLALLEQRLLAWHPTYRPRQ